MRNVGLTVAWTFAVGLILMLIPPAWAKTLHGANNGVDNPTCGADGTPCRSITQAITHASDGDRIVVGPGRYGELDGSGSLGDSEGEETPPVGCSCMILVDKALSLESRDGAGATILDVGEAELGEANVPVVVIEASSVVFGKRRKGFTLTGGARGLSVALGTSRVTVAGNRINGRGDAFRVFGDHHLIADNMASNAATGFSIFGNEHMVTHNVAVANRGTGFFIFDSGHKIFRNVAKTNQGAGFQIRANDHVVTGNIASGNNGNGFAVFDSGHKITRNAALGNKGVGIHTASSNSTITRNNLFGNEAGGANCGVRNASGTAIAAPNNYWGTATGPGADPGDTVCSATPDDLINFGPFASKEFRIRVQVGR